MIIPRPTICVLLSSYNGAEHLARQVESILAQSGDFKITIYLRDDGSEDGTLKIATSYSEIKLDPTSGQRLGWRASFHHLLNTAPRADYYAFSDQDDIWFVDKLATAVKAIDTKPKDQPTLWQCQPDIVNAELEPLKYKETFTRPPHYKRALADLHALGSGQVFNRALLELYQTGAQKPANDLWQTTASHDTYLFILAYLFGHTIFDPHAHFYWIRYGHSVTVSSRRQALHDRLRKFLRGRRNAYARHDREILTQHADRLTPAQRKFFELLAKYKQGANRCKLFFDAKFTRSSIIGKIFFKLTILLGRY